MVVKTHEKMTSIKKWAKYWNRHCAKEVIQRADEHMKIFSIVYVNMELQMKTMSYHYTPVEMAKIWNTDHIKG